MRCMNERSARRAARGWLSGMLAIAGLAVVSSPTLAQVRMTQNGSTRPISIAVGGGISVPTGDYRDALKNGFNGQGSIIFNLAGLPLALRADLNYNRFDVKQEAIDVPGAPTLDDVTQQVLGGLANITIPFNLGPVAPYITAGLGAFNVKTNFGDGYSGDSESETKFAINGGAGLSIRLFGASAFIEARLNNVYTERGAITTQELKDLQFIPVTFGFLF
jgi:opacity protein-like surface antigen